ncbi:hypothetical protein [Sphingosinicella humi]|uniref:Sugar transporter n=1 Tax=Allosphingosinicella humi TaxID=2068657 RepID=A0A2U2J5P6_9SPHN|nr:hypothetical protein [Sphingosinicella humi]PWG03654.1 hypothetical protein DF286_12785 [Sphingosinicella humi]
MNEAAVARPTTWYWVVATLALLWNLIGVASYLMTVYGAVPTVSEAQSTLEAATPAWVMGAFAIAAFGGALGSLGLLLRKRWAKILLVVSLIAALAQQLWLLVLSDALALMGPSAAILPATVIVVAVLLVWFATVADRRGWLN